MTAKSTKTRKKTVSSNNTKTSASEGFFDEVVREAGFRRCIILHGNARDLFDDGKKHYMSLPKAILTRLAAIERDGQRCFDICGCWDRIDGLRFMDTMQQQAFQRVLKHSCSDTTSGARPASTGQTEYDDGSGDRATQVDKSLSAGGMYKEPKEAFAAMRQVLSHDSEKAVFVLNWSDYFVANPTHQDLAERQLLTLLGKAIAEQPLTQTGSDALKGPTGLLVIITSNLERTLPLSLYENNPRTKVITVPRPDRPQRLAFFTQHQRDLQVAEPKPAPGQPTRRYSSCAAILSQMADLCDGLTTVDMQNLLALSCQLPSKIPPDHLVNHYKFGKQNSPWKDLDDRRLDNVAEELKKWVMGQDHAMEAVEVMLKSSYMGLGGEEKQPQVLFFAGPTGVGKTETAKGIARFLFRDESALIHFDMSEYSHAHDDLRLVGAPPSYVGFEQGGQLTNVIREKPFCVIVFDEIEKAHGSIFDKFLQILEEGRLTDGRGQTVFFDQTVIIFTSNIGQDCENLVGMDPASLEAHFKEKVISYLADPPRADGKGGLNRPELVDRIGEDNIIAFRYITDPDIRKKILRSKLARIEEVLHERFGMRLEVSDRCIDWLESRSQTGIIRRDITNIVKRYFSKNRLAMFAYEHRHQLKPGRILSTDVPAKQDDIKFAIREGKDGTKT